MGRAGDPAAGITRNIAAFAPRADLAAAWGGNLVAGRRMGSGLACCGGVFGGVCARLQRRPDCAGFGLPKAAGQSLGFPRRRVGVAAWPGGAAAGVARGWTALGRSVRPLAWGCNGGEFGHPEATRTERLDWGSSAWSGGRPGSRCWPSGESGGSGRSGADWNQRLCVGQSELTSPMTSVVPNNWR